MWQDFSSHIEVLRVPIPAVSVSETIVRQYLNGLTRISAPGHCTGKVHAAEWPACLPQRALTQQHASPWAHRKGHVAVQHEKGFEFRQLSFCSS